MFLVFNYNGLKGSGVINMDKVAAIDVQEDMKDGTLKILVRMTSIREWPMHQKEFLGYSPLENAYRIKKESWIDFTNALNQNKMAFIFDCVQY